MAHKKAGGSTAMVAIQTPNILELSVMVVKLSMQVKSL